MASHKTTSLEPFDGMAKSHYRRLFESWGLVVETEREVFSSGRKIDIVVTCPPEEHFKLENTVFSHFKRLNAIELKGIHDPLTLKDYNRIMMRVWGLGGLDSGKKKEDEEADDAEELEDEAETEAEDENKDDTDETQLNRLPTQRTLTIVCVTRPNKILNQLKKELRFFQTKEPGIYRCRERLSQWIIHPTELTLSPKNYPLLPLARGKKLEQFVALCLKKGLIDYLKLTLDIGILTDPNVILQKILEMQQMKPKIHEDTWRSLEQFFQKMPEKMKEVPIFQDVLAARRDERQRILIRLLRRKFASVPENVVQTIEATNDTALLDNWLDQIIVADSLASIGF